MMTRAQVAAMAPRNPKLAQTVFGPESIASKRNTEAIEIGPNTLMAARVVEYKPAAPRPFAEVKDEIAAQMQRKSAGELAAKEGEARLAELEQGKPATLAWDKPKEITRQQQQPGFSADAMVKIFRASSAKLHSTA